MGQKMTRKQRRALEQMGYATTSEHVYVERDGKMTIQDPKDVAITRTPVEIITKDAAGVHHAGHAQLMTYVTGDIHLIEHTVPGNVEEVIYPGYFWQKRLKRLQITRGLRSAVPDPAEPTPTQQLLSDYIMQQQRMPQLLAQYGYGSLVSTPQ